MQDVIGELRQSARALTRTSGAAPAVVATLAVALGGAIAIFSFVDGVLLRPLPWPEPERLVVACEAHRDQPPEFCGASPANLADWTRESPSLESAVLARNWRFSRRREDGRLEAIRGGVATAGLLGVFGVHPQLGRDLQPQDLEAGRPRVVLLSDAFWRERLGSDPGVVGRTLVVDAEPHTVVGVTPRGFAVPGVEPVDLWVPLWPERADARWWRGFHPFGRLAPGADASDAQAELELIAARLAREHPETNAGWGVAVASLHDHVVRSVRPALLALFGAVLLVLLIACVNVANLLLARATVRERELAVRAALGAGRRRLTRQLLLEGLLLAAAGAAGGALIGVWTVELFVRLAPPELPRLAGVAVDARALGFGALLALLAALLFSLAPMLGTRRLDLRAAMPTGVAGGERPGRGRLRAALVTAELAFALMLLVGGGLLGRSFAALLDWQPGFERDGLLAIQVFPPVSKYPDRDQLTPLVRQAVAELAALPGVVAAGAGSAGPLFGGDGGQEVYREDRPAPEAGARLETDWFDVDPGYFATLGVPVVRGRDITERDGPGAPAVAVINETLARALFPGEDPIGKPLRLVMTEMSVEVVGVVRDVAPFLPGEAPRPQVYWPFAQQPRWAVHLLLRAGGGAAPDLAPAVRARLAELDPDLELGPLFTLEDRVRAQLVTPRFNAALLGGFALLAVGLAGIGVYGVVAFSVSRRTREIGVRLALGARRRDVVIELLRGGAPAIALGTGLGLVGAVVVARLLGSLLHGVAPTDIGVLAGAGAALALLAFAATLIPALRASRLDPAHVLRQE